MFQRLKRLRLPFLPKKLVEIPLEELIVSAIEEAKNYPLIQDSDELSELFKNKFKTATGIQIPPREIMAKIINHIEKNPPLSTKEFAAFVRATIAAVPPPNTSKKHRFWKRSK
jgi:hypothetical protein